MRLHACRVSGATVVSYAFCSLNGMPALYELWMERLTAEAIGTGTHAPPTCCLVLICSADACWAAPAVLPAST